MFRFLLITLYLIAFAAILYYFYDGLDFYSLAFQERPHHESYANLKPGGFRGHGLGVVGSALMLLLLLYSVRKRMRLFTRAGSISRWLDVHILFGITGPLFVILHTSFKLNGIVALSFWSMIAVALSGVLGRYIYLQIPRGKRGHELSLEETERMNSGLNERLTSKFEIDPKVLNQIQVWVTGNISTEWSLPRILISLLINDMTRNFRIRKMRKYLLAKTQLPRANAHMAARLAVRKALLTRRIVLWEKIDRIFHYWHVIHKPFAIIMYIIMLVHVLITVWLGYTWL